jgi:UDP-GlcNAc:undecaprenyl-phosphate/decaprenyl-phosphate GlcNAc-1-phosphate transferase
MQSTEILFSLFVFTLISLIFNYLILKWTKTLGAKNAANVGEIRWSDSYKPAIGGVSFFIVFLIAYLVYLFAYRPSLSLTEETQHLGILIAITIGFFTGLADDAYNTVPWLKLVAQITTGFVLIYTGVVIDFFGIELADAILTIFWTVAVMNSINMLDNMDGVTASVSVFILFSAALTAYPLTDNNLFYTFVCGGTAAAIVGFLYFNWNPSKMFMGDTGSQMLGALLAAIGILFFWNNENVIETGAWWQKIAIVAVAFAVPIGDSLTVTINRIKRGQSPLVGGRDHTTHHLSFAGLSDRNVALVMVGFSLISSTLIGLLSLSESLQHTGYYIVLICYAVAVIGFLYSTTVWKKSRQVYLEKHAPKK